MGLGQARGPSWFKRPRLRATQSAPLVAPRVGFVSMTAVTVVCDEKGQRPAVARVVIGGHTSGLAGCLGAMFWATTHAADAIAQEMKNAVHGRRALGAASIAGPQTRRVNRLIMPASAIAATRGKIENSTPRPQAICPAPVR